MKKLWFMMLLLMAAFSFSLTSCSSDDEEQLQDDVTVDQWRTNIVGLWNENGTTDYYRFSADGKGAKATPSTGKYWDTEDDITEDEADRFQWYIESEGLYLNHCINGSYMGYEPVITILSITSTSMQWKDNDGLLKTFTKK